MSRVLGFGCMRLLYENGSGTGADHFDPNKAIDEEETIRMIRYAIDQGVNYFDTAYPYHSGKSEPILGRAVHGYRDKVLIATKLPVWLVKEEKDFNKFLDEQMRRLGTDYLDVYLLHGLNRQVWSKMMQLKVSTFLDQIRSDGRIRHVGFSFHDEVKMFKEIVGSYDWEICQIQYNFFDENYQAGKEGLTYAASKGLRHGGDGTASRGKIDSSDSSRGQDDLGAAEKKEDTGRMGPSMGVESS